MNNVVRTYLIELARKRANQTVSYQKICDDCKLKLEMSNPHHRNRIAEILEQISLYEHENERPLLSALVLRSYDGTEGDGFYKLAEKLNFGGWSKLKRDGIFEIEEIKKCIDFWSDDIKYNKFK